SVVLASVARSAPISRASRAAIWCACRGSRNATGIPLVSPCQGSSDELGCRKPRYSAEVKSGTASPSPRAVLLVFLLGLVLEQPPRQLPSNADPERAAGEAPPLFREPLAQQEGRLGEPIGRQLCLPHVRRVGREVDARDRVVNVDVPLHLLSPVARPVASLFAVDDVAPVTEADREEKLLAEDREITEVANRRIGPPLQLFHRIDAVHPPLRVDDHRAGRQERAEFGS